jgi:hypothetical protein
VYLEWTQSLLLLLLKEEETGQTDACNFESKFTVPQWQIHQQEQYGRQSWSKVQEFWKSTLVTVAAGENLVWVSPEFVQLH